MACEDTSGLLAGYVDGEVSDDDAQRVEEHLASCPDCARVIRSLHAVRAAATGHDAALFDPHPGSEVLSRYVVGDPEMRTEHLAGLAGHVRSCPTCGHEAELARRAVRAADGWLARARALVSPGARLWIPAPVPVAVAAAVALLAVPAYLGLRGTPEVWPGGALPALLLEGETRGAALPELNVDRRSPFTLILVEVRAGFSPRDEMLTARLRDPGGREVWRHTADASTAFAAETGIVSLAVPTHLLRPGVHELELLITGAESLRAVRFRVRE